MLNILAAMLPLISVSFLSFLLLCSSLPVANGGNGAPNLKNSKVISIGAIVDYSSLVGKEDETAIRMAVDNFYKNCVSHKPILHIRDSSGDPSRAAFAADELIRGKQVHAIIGLRTWEEAASIGEIGNKDQVPILSLADVAPSWASRQWPFLAFAVHDQYKQMKVVADIVRSWQWRRVTVIYQETSSTTAGIFPYLVDALREVESEIAYIMPLPPLSAASHSFLSVELDKLRSQQNRVFIVHTSLPLAIRLFKQAKNKGMMGKGYVWITTSGVTNLIDSVNSSVISSMEGVIGVRSHFSKTTMKFKDFSLRFHSKFRKEYPIENTISNITIFSLQAYDATWAIALAIEGKSFTKMVCNSTNHPSGLRLLNRILSSNFKGLTGEFNFTNQGKLPTENTFEIINVVGKSYRELGYWVEGKGFLESIDDKENSNASMRILGQVFWPGGPWSVPRGWATPTIENTLRIGVPNKTTFEQFVNVRYDHLGSDPVVNGFSIDVFKATLEYLPYHLSYTFIPHDGSYDSLVRQVHQKVFDAVIADTAIIANRYQYVEFSQPYSDSGVQIVVYDRSRVPNKAWLFLKPFTTHMWAATGAINLFNGFVVWLIERDNLKLQEQSIWHQIGTLIWFSFTTLFSVHSSKVQNNLSKITMVVWLFVALVITTSYTASLTTMLTIQQLDPTMVTVESLRKSNAMVGCDGNSFVVKYLETVLHINPKNIKKMNTGDDYPQALKNGEIAAAFLEVPYVKLLLSKYCDILVVAGPSFKVGSFGFVFAKGSPMLGDISEAILKVTESGKLRDLENALVSSYNCSAKLNTDHTSLKPSSFSGLFGISLGTSAISLSICLFRWYVLGRCSSTEDREENTIDQDHAQVVNKADDDDHDHAHHEDATVEPIDEHDHSENHAQESAVVEAVDQDDARHVDGHERLCEAEMVYLARQQD